MKNITSRFPATCRDCKSPIGAGESIWWERGFGSVCDACFTKPAAAPAAAARTTADHGIEEWEGGATFTRGEIEAAKRAIMIAAQATYGPRVGDLEPVCELGPDALAAEIDACCSALSPEYDGTPDEIFYRSEKDGRRFDAYRRVLDTLAGEQKGRDTLAAMNRQENDEVARLERLGKEADRSYERMAEGL